MSKYSFDFTEKLAKLKKQEESSKSFGDNRFWKLASDPKTKKGSAIIRFLPDRPSADALPYVKYFSHWFNYHDGNIKQRYINNCPTTIGRNCPICTKNRELWKSPHESDLATARHRKRKIHYVSNILVISDPANPDNEGKVFLFNYGPQIYTFLSRALYGPMEDDEDYVEGKDYSDEMWVPFDLFNGGDFYLRSTQKKNSDFLTYAPSEWGDKGVPIFPDLDDEERIEKLDEIFAEKNRNGVNTVSKLDEWVDPKRFPNDEEVVKKLEPIFGNNVNKYVSDSDDNDDSYDDDSSDDYYDTPSGDTPNEDVIDSEDSSEKTEKKKESRSDEMSDEDYLDNLLGD